MDARQPYVVRSVSKTGSVSYRCPTVDWALRKLRDFQAAGREDITVTGPDGALLTETDLVGLLDGSGAAPSEDALPAAPEINRQPALA